MPNFDQDAQPFSSTFSTREWLLVKSIGVQPVSQVMGTAFMQLPKNKKDLLSVLYPYGYGKSSYTNSTYQSRSNRDYGAGRFVSNVQPVTGEIYALTSIRLDARQLAVSRMRLEAENLGASGVIAVRMKTEIHNWGDCLTLECTALGTAVTVPDWREEKPFTSLMHAQQFWRLWQAGYQPCGIAIGACSYSDCAEASVLKRSYNQEVGSYTASFYDAHELAMRAFSKNVRQLQGAGAVGMKVEYDFEDLEKELEVAEGVSMTYQHLITHFVITGTAIKRRQGNVAPAHQSTLRILDLSNVASGRHVSRDLLEAPAQQGKNAAKGKAKKEKR